MMKRNLTLLLLLLCSITSIFASTPSLIGRRGCGYAVENSAEAYREGARLGYKTMEAHVRLTADSVFVTSHDGKTDRLGGHMKVASSTLDSLKTERYHQTREHGDYSGSTICTVEEFLSICAANDVTPMLHLKTLSKNTAECAFLTDLVALIDNQGLKDRCIILTSEPDYIDYLIANHPSVKLQYQADAKWEEMFDWSCSRKLDVQIRADLVDEECVRRYHDAGVKVDVWTVNTPEELEKIGKFGVDYAVTDYLLP
ncbi:MAG: hypothetical protein NC212_02205 [Staphylococcus sp.]|nr:hypothetical protein [Staphylococcus sp.]